MNRILKTIGAFALLLTIGPSILHFYDLMTPDAMRITMLAGCVLWFTTASLIEWRRKRQAAVLPSPIERPNKP